MTAASVALQISYRLMLDCLPTELMGEGFEGLTISSRQVDPTNCRGRNALLARCRAVPPVPLPPGAPPRSHFTPAAGKTAAAAKAASALYRGTNKRRGSAASTSGAHNLHRASSP